MLVWIFVHIHHCLPSLYMSTLNKRDWIFSIILGALRKERLQKTFRTSDSNRFNAGTAPSYGKSLVFLKVFCKMIEKIQSLLFKVDTSCRGKAMIDVDKNPNQHHCDGYKAYDKDWSFEILFSNQSLNWSSNPEWTGKTHFDFHTKKGKFFFKKIFFP